LIYTQKKDRLQFLYVPNTHGRQISEYQFCSQVYCAETVKHACDDRTRIVCIARQAPIAVSQYSRLHAIHVFSLFSVCVF